MRAVVDAVVIGRNEGARLLACLASLQGQVRHLVYVDSGSTDGSVQAAQALGAEVVTLDVSLGFTAARARNAGLALLQSPDFVQFVDGDCEVEAGWLGRALQGFATHPAAVVICGRRRERFPEASVYNRLADAEWDTPLGQTSACGGDALMRFSAVQAVGGYDAKLIAGEEPDLCLRLRRAGGEVWRVDAAMTLHDANLMRFDQWWRRTVRAGFAFAEGTARNGAAPERLWIRETGRAVFWGIALPLCIGVAGIISVWGWVLALSYPVQMARLAWRGGWAWGFYTMVGKFAEARGVISYWANRWAGRRRGLIEYK
jgi:GT2 family glycosyltransferase